MAKKNCCQKRRKLLYGLFLFVLKPTPVHSRATYEIPVTYFFVCLDRFLNCDRMEKPYGPFRTVHFRGCWDRDHLWNTALNVLFHDKKTSIPLQWSVVKHYVLHVSMHAPRQYKSHRHNSPSLRHYSMAYIATFNSFLLHWASPIQLSMQQWKW